MKSAVTISLVPEARGGPFVFWDDLDRATREAMDLGFDAIEILPPDAQAISNLNSPMRIAAVGTGAGWVKHQLTFTCPDAGVRNRAIEFARTIVDAAGQLGAPAIIGSMQGRWGGPASHEESLKHLADALAQLAARAERHGAMLIYEPLNRYETNLVNTLRQGVEFVRTLSVANVKLLADLFHMNIEERNLAAAIREVGEDVGHVHLADSNRRPAEYGHTDFKPIAHALRAIGYDGYLSAEALPYPDSSHAAQATMAAFNKFFR